MEEKKMFSINSDTIDKLMSMDGDFSKLYLYLLKNNINAITEQNKKDISIATFISFKKMDYIINFYKFNNIMPKDFENCLSNSFSNSVIKQENDIEKSNVDEKLIMELNEYVRANFKNNLDYSSFFRNAIEKYSFDKEIYLYLIDICQLENRYENIVYMGKLLADWDKNNLKTKEEIKNYLTLKNFNKAGDILKEKGLDILSTENINKEKELYNYSFRDFK